MSKLQHVIVGLPFSGKTTYLAALWHLLDAGEIDTTFVLDKLEGDHAYLNSIVEAWRKCEEMPRTSMAAEKDVAIHVRQVSTGNTAVLHFPDMSGETFERQFSLRTCNSNYVERFENDGGILLFVTANRSTDGVTIADINSMGDLGGATTIGSSGEHREWSAEMTPTQVVLVDLLQFLQRPPFRRVKRRVAVIVSAWDVIDNPDLDPSRWFERELPLLDHFLSTNQSQFEYRVYGVSGQGGDVKGVQKTKLAEKIPSERIICVGPETVPHDLTSPFSWLMSSA